MQNSNCSNNFLKNNNSNESKEPKIDSDKLYTKIYENEIGRQGLDICIEKCKGYCVEYGILGKAFCFEDIK